GVAGADRPHAAGALLGQQRQHGVGGAADLEGVDRLQVLELEVDLAAGLVPGAAEGEQRGLDDDAAEALAGGCELVERDGGARVVGEVDGLHGAPSLYGGRPVVNGRVRRSEVPGSPDALFVVTWR